jgi:uncharacterized lipoprotein YddW (UPF0748 family)
MRPHAIASAAALLGVVSCCQARTEYRAFWVDTFNTSLNSHSDVTAIVSQARAANANMILAQVRRRGDSWYLNSLEPLPDFTPFDLAFDPLQDLIHEAHANAIEVHAFTIIGAIWNKNPSFPPSATLGPPLDANHVFNRHGGYDPVTQQVLPGPDNWLTRTLLPDQAGISFQGHRIGSDFWIDLGHPDAAAYTVKVLMQLVRNYDLDGLHLDRIRYPDLSVSGQTVKTGANIGYNPRSVTRFQQRYGIPGDAAPPDPGDPLWAQWRRDQVTNLVRRIYLNAIAIRPQLKISAALIAFGDGPVLEESWMSAEAFWRVYQDWRAWTEQGILDIAIPMNYKREHIPAQATWTDHWNEWTKDHQYARSAMIGLGVYLNSIEGTLRQIRRTLDKSTAGNSAIGVSLYSLANPDSAVPANPLSIPPGQDTPARGAAGLASALTVSNFPFEDLSANPVPVFAESAVVPVLSWKASPARGHVMGFVKRADGTSLDSGLVTITSLDGSTKRTTSTDGGGFYGTVDLPPGAYMVTAELGSDRVSVPRFEVVPGLVTRVDLPAQGARRAH